MSYIEHRARYIRSGILSMLATTPGEAGSDVLLHEALARTEFRAGLDTITVQLRWLGERRYVKLEELGDIVFATITQRGIDLVEGRESDPDVIRVRPR